MRLSTMITAVGGVVAAAFVLTGCGGQQGGSAAPGSASPQGFNQADVTFAQQMIVHHQQAVMMADMADDRAQSPQVKQLAAQIKAEQEPEIETMTGWLNAWGQATASASQTPGTASQMPTPSGMPHMPIPTMTIPPEMPHMHGADFDRMFLQMMIAHHEEAVAMARAEQTSGENANAKQLAQHIETSQTTQIGQMQQMLNTVAPSPS